MKGQEAWFEDDINLYANPAGTLGQLRFLGADRVRLAVRWYQIAPTPLSRRSTRASEEPISPIPTSATRSNSGLFMPIVPRP